MVRVGMRHTNMSNEICRFWIQCSRFQYEVRKDPFKTAYYLVKKECSFSDWKKVTEYTEGELKGFTEAVQEMSKLETNAKILKEIKTLESDRTKLKAEYEDTVAYISCQHAKLKNIDNKLIALKDKL